MGAAIVYGVYSQGIHEYENQIQRLAQNSSASFDRVSLTGGIFATYPAPYVTVGQVLADQIFSVFVLMTAILAITDEKGINTPRALQPISVGLVLFILIVSYGVNCGATINPGKYFIILSNQLECHW